MGGATALRVLFCCMGNICRSPTAEGVLRRSLAAEGLQARILIDSAGTHDYHVGHPPDHRACRAAVGRGYDLDALRARQVGAGDFNEFDYVLAMDRENLAALESIAPVQHRGKAKLLMDFAATHTGADIPDPYFGSDGDFDLVLDLIEEGVQGLIEDMKKRLDL
jgi:protein-tyrosine phosphatase